MNHLDLFTGIGGFSLAAQWMEWETVAQVEWDGWCQKVLAKNFPNALRFGDIIEFNKMLQNGEIIGYTESAGKTDIREVFREGQGYQQSTDTIGVDTITEGRTGCVSLGEIDIITGGFPCQPFSHAGKRKGTDDSRYLWPEMLTTIRILKPTFVVGENVAGLVSMENGKTLDRILSDLENEGYTVESFIIPACAIVAWHRRDRIWIIAYNTRSNEQRKCEQQSQQGKYRRLGSINATDTLNTSTSRYRENGRDISEESEPNRFNCISKEWWATEPAVGRVANGIPNRVDRLKGLGNTIVPQVAFEIFKTIEQYDLGNNHN